jgi:hypothetical protein
MIQLLAPLLGGLGGLLFPAAGAAAAGGAAATGIGALLSKAALPALGAGLGTLVSGGGGKDAIRNALLMGVGVTALPGVASGIQQSGFGRSVTGGLANIFGAGADQVSGPSQSAGAYSAPPRRPETMTSTSGAPMADGQGMTGMEDEARGRMTTLPTLAEMSSQAFENAQGMGLGSPRMTPTLQEMANQAFASAQSMNMGLPSVPSTQMMAGQAFENAQGMGLGSPRFMPPTGIAARNMDVQRAMDMAAVDASRFDDVLAAMSERGSSPGLRYAGDKYMNRMGDLLDIANRRERGRGFAMGGEIEGPGTGTSDSIPAEIYQDGKPVQKAALSDGEFVMTANAVKGAGNGSRDRGVKRMYELMRRFESGEMV